MGKRGKTAAKTRRLHPNLRPRTERAIGGGHDYTRKVFCDLCGQQAEAAGGSRLFPKIRRLHGHIFWQCVPCDARVGCHKGTNIPLGKLANAETRIARRQAHIAFDRLWKHEIMERNEAYKWLADQLGIHRKHCHIGLFDAQEANIARNLCIALFNSRQGSP